MQMLSSARKVETGGSVAIIDQRPHMARRYDLPDVGWELIKYLVSPGKKDEPAAE